MSKLREHERLARLLRERPEVAARAAAARLTIIGTAALLVFGIGALAFWAIGAYAPAAFLGHFTVFVLAELLRGPRT